MQVDFYHLTRDPAEKLLPVIAQKTLYSDSRLLVVSADFDQIERISAGLWQSKPESFLAHGLAGCETESAQPILISDECAAVNGARFIALADGIWRDETLAFERVFYLFTPDQIDDARKAWRTLTANEDATPRYWKQDGGRWVEGP